MILIVWIFLVVFVVVDIFLITVYLACKKEQNIGESYKHYDLTLNKPLVIDLRELPIEEDRMLVVMGLYDFPRYYDFPRHEGERIEVLIEAYDTEEKMLSFNRNYEGYPIFHQKIAEFDPKDVSSLQVRLLRLDNVPSDKIQISVGSSYQTEAYAIVSLCAVCITVVTALSVICGGVLLLI